MTSTQKHTRLSNICTDSRLPEHSFSFNIERVMNIARGIDLHLVRVSGRQSMS